MWVMFCVLVGISLFFLVFFCVYERFCVVFMFGGSISIEFIIVIVVVVEFIFWVKNMNWEVYGKGFIYGYV